MQSNKTIEFNIFITLIVLWIGEKLNNIGPLTLPLIFSFAIIWNLPVVSGDHTIV